MRITESQPLPRTGIDPSAEPQVNNPEEAARKFEEVLARQFVEVMTKDLFKKGLSGEDGPAWMGSYADNQRDILTRALAQHLVDRGTLGLSELILRRWNAPAANDASIQAEPSAASLPSVPEEHD